MIDLEGKRVDGRLVLSSEVPMHMLVYQSTDAAAVVHTHPLYASTLSVLVDELPAVHYLIALLGGPVRVAPYARYGSPELAENSVRVMDGRYALILQNHGATPWVRTWPGRTRAVSTSSGCAGLLPGPAARRTAPTVRAGDQRGRRPAQDVRAAGRRLTVRNYGCCRIINDIRP